MISQIVCYLIQVETVIEISHFECYNTFKPIDIIRRGQSRVITADNILITIAVILRIIWIPQIIRRTGIHIF